MSTETPTTAKPWYKSKIILLAVSAVAVFGTNALTGFLTGSGVTPEQIEVIRTVEPQIADAVEQYKNGNNILSVTVGVLIPALIAVARKWFTNVPLLK